MEGSRDPGDGTGGSFRGARYRADAGNCTRGTGTFSAGSGTTAWSGRWRRWGRKGIRSRAAGVRSRRERIYAETAEQVRRQVDADRVLLVESGEDPGTGRVAWALSPDGRGPGPEGYEPLGDSYVGWVIRTGTQRIFPGAAGPREARVSFGIVGEGRGAVVPGPAGGGQGGVSGRPGLRPPAGETVPETARGDRAGHHKGHASSAFPTSNGSNRSRKRRPRTG